MYIKAKFLFVMVSRMLLGDGECNAVFICMLNGCVVISFQYFLDFGFLINK